MSQSYEPQSFQNDSMNGNELQNDQAQLPVNVHSPMVWSVLSTIFCCIPTGIVSIVYAAKVNTLLAVGNVTAAAKAASSAKMWAWISVVLGIISNIAFFALMSSAMSSVNDAAKTIQNANNLKQVSLAMITYSEVKKTLPPAYSEDGGARLHSWRVELLPYLDENDLYQQIHLDEPWDSEWNKQFHDKCPKVFQNPLTQLAPGETTYAVVVGENTAFPGSEGVRMINIQDGCSNTIMVVERTPVCWMDPNSDIPFEEAIKGVNVSPNGIQSYSAKGFQTSFCDGSCHIITKTISNDDLRKLILTNDGEVVDTSSLDARP